MHDQDKKISFGRMFRQVLVIGGFPVALKKGNKYNKKKKVLAIAEGSPLCHPFFFLRISPTHISFCMGADFRNIPSCCYGESNFPRDFGFRVRCSSISWFYGTVWKERLIIKQHPSTSQNTSQVIWFLHLIWFPHQSVTVQAQPH